MVIRGFSDGDNRVVLPRFVRRTIPNSGQVIYCLCGFGDASKRAYAAVCWLN